jgi:hypothetical protein
LLSMLPRVRFRLRNPRVGRWVELEGDFDPGSSRPCLPASYMEELAVLPWTEHRISIATPGGRVSGYLAVLDLEVEGCLMPSCWCAFRESDDELGPLLGEEPVSDYFNVLLDYGNGAVRFIPRKKASNTLLDLRQVVARITD